VSFGDFLRAVPHGASLRMASAYCTVAGALEVDRVIRPTRVELLAGVDDFITEPSLLRGVPTLAERWVVRPVRAATVPSPDRRYQGRRIFHPKVLWAGSGASSIAYIGSGNLTAGGLGRNVELGVMLRGPGFQSELAAVWGELERYAIKAFDVGAYERRRAHRPALGVVADLVPHEEQVLVLEWNPLGQGSTQLQFSPAIAHAFFGAFEDGEASRTVWFLRNGTSHRVRLSDHYRGQAEPRTFGLNLGRALRATLRPRFRAGYALIFHREDGRYDIGLTAAKSTLGRWVHDAAESALLAQRGQRGARSGHLMAAVLRRARQVRPDACE